MGFAVEMVDIDSPRPTAADLQLMSSITSSSSYHRPTTATLAQLSRLARWEKLPAYYRLSLSGTVATDHVGLALLASKARELALLSDVVLSQAQWTCLVRRCLGKDWPVEVLWICCAGDAQYLGQLAARTK